MLAAWLAVVPASFAPSPSHGAGEPSRRAGRETALASAARRGDLGVLRSLLDGGATLDEPSRRGLSALGAAVDAQRLDAVRLLLAAGADPYAPSARRSALFLALGRRGRSTLPVLLEGKRSSRPEATAGIVEQDPRLLEFTASLVAADAGGRLRRLFASLPGGLDPSSTDAKGWPLLGLAARDARLRAARALLASGADVHAVKPGAGTALEIALRRRNYPLVALLTSAGASWSRLTPEARALRPVAAAHAADLSFLPWMAGHGAIDARDERGRTLLHVAARAANDEALRLLLASGASVSATVRHGDIDTGWTALHVAAGDAPASTVTMLALAGSDLHRRSTLGATPLLVASLHGRAQTVAFLLSRGADPRVADSTGLLAPGPLAAAAGHAGVAAQFGLVARELPREFQPKPQPKPQELPKPPALPKPGAAASTGAKP